MARAVMGGQRVLVTGAAGFIGRWSIAPLAMEGFDVHAVMSPGAAREVPAELRGSTVHRCDLLDATAIRALFDRVRPTHLLHFAWIATPSTYWTSADNSRWLAASQFLLDAFQRCGGVRAVMAGTCAEYDWSRADRCDERITPLADEAGAAISLYAACKLAMQRALAAVGAREGLSTAWGRIFFQFGPYEHPGRLVPSVIRHLLLDQDAPCSHGRQIRSFLHATDVGSAFAKLVAGDVEGPVNIGSEEAISIRDLLERIERLTQKPGLLRFGARAVSAAEPAVLIPQTQRLRDEVRWRPQFSLDDGLSDVIHWWQTKLNPAAPPETRR